MQNLLMEQFGPSPAEMVPLEGGKTNRLWRSGDQVVKLLNAAGAALRLNPNEDRFPTISQAIILSAHSSPDL